MGTLRWFGHRYDARAWDDMPQTPAPVGRECVHCRVAITATDDGLTLPDASSGERLPVHVPCFLRNLGIATMPCRIDGPTDGR